MASRWAIPAAAHWDWGSTGVWSSSDGGSTGASVPVSNDTVTIKQGAFTLDTGLNQSAVTLTRLNIYDGYGGDASGVSIGDTAGNALQINATDLYISTTRLAFIRLSGAFTNVYVNNLGGCQLFISGGSVTNFYGFARSGYVEIADDVELTTFYTAGMNAKILGDSTSPNDLDFNIAAGANVECWRKFSTGVCDGRLTAKGAASLTISSGTAKLSVTRNGVLDYQASGALGQITAHDGSTVTTGNAPGYATPPTLDKLIKLGTVKGSRPTSRLTITSEVAGDEPGSIGGA